MSGYQGLKGRKKLEFAGVIPVDLTKVFPRAILSALQASGTLLLLSPQAFSLGFILRARSGLGNGDNLTILGFPFQSEKRFRPHPAGRSRNPIASTWDK